MVIECEAVHAKDNNEGVLNNFIYNSVSSIIFIE